MPEIRPNPSVLLKSIEANAANVRDAANALTQRIDLFEQYLNRLPAKTETAVFGVHPDQGIESTRTSFVLALRRDGKDWRLLCGTKLGPSLSPLAIDSIFGRDGVELKPVRDAAIKYKLAAIKMFPDLLESIARSQDQLVDDIVHATTDFDTFAAALGIDVKQEGK